MANLPDYRLDLYDSKQTLETGAATLPWFIPYINADNWAASNTNRIERDELFWNGHGRFSQGANPIAPITTRINIR